MSVHDFLSKSSVRCIFEMHRKIRAFSKMLVSGIIGSLLGLGCLNAMLGFCFIWMECLKIPPQLQTYFEKVVQRRRFSTKNNKKKT